MPKRRPHKKSSKRPSSKSSQKKGFSLHHIRPRSRGGSSDTSNLYPRNRWESYTRKHVTWHTLFENMTPEEVVAVLKLYFEPDGRIANAFFALGFSVEQELIEGAVRWVVRISKNRNRVPKKREAWTYFFGDMNAHHAIGWITREFIHKVWLRENGNGRKDLS